MRLDYNKHYASLTGICKSKGLIHTDKCETQLVSRMTIALTSGHAKTGKDFSNWIKDRIEQYGFIENQDFIVFAKIGGNPKGGRPAKVYAISIDMAKELLMVELIQPALKEVA